jgi:DNA-binding transcriptional LysR family regulator
MRMVPDGLSRSSVRATSSAAGLGLAYVTEDSVQAYLAEGRLIRVLADWCPSYPGRQPTPAFTLLVDALRYRG